MPAKKKRRSDVPKVIARLERTLQLKRKITTRVKEIGGLLGIKRKRSMIKISQKTVAVVRDLKQLASLQTDLIIDLIRDGEIAMGLVKLKTHHI